MKQREKYRMRLKHFRDHEDAVLYIQKLWRGRRQYNEYRSLMRLEVRFTVSRWLPLWLGSTCEVASCGNRFMALASPAPFPAAETVAGLCAQVLASD